MSADKLKPCPFCGDTPEISEMRWKNDMGGNRWTLFHRPNPVCTLAGSIVGKKPTQELLIKYWNFRKAEDSK